MIDKIFIQIINMSLSAAFVIAAVLLIRMLLKKAPKVFSYALWAVVLFRLICPYSIESGVSLVPANVQAIPTSLIEEQLNEIDSGIPLINDSGNYSLNDVGAETTDRTNGETAKTFTLRSLMSLLIIIWLAGIAALLGYSVVSLIKLRRKLIGAVRMRDNIYLSDHIDSPFVIGLLHPKIYLPSTLFDCEKDYIIIHEQMHVRRGDHIVKLVAFFTLAVHWFNPLVWLAFILAASDMEMSCDEAVMRRMDSDIRGEYSASLLSLATGRRIIAGTPLAFGEGDTKGRIRNVMNYKKPAYWVVIAALCVVIAVIICLAVNPVSEQSIVIPARFSLDVDEMYSPPTYFLYEDGYYSYTAAADSENMITDSGTYEIDANKLTFTSDIGQHNVYIFKIKDGNLVFQADKSAEIRVFGADFKVSDGDVFVREFDWNNALQSDPDYSDFVPYDTFIFDGLDPEYMLSYREEFVLEGDSAVFSYIITYEPMGLTLEVGLLAEDGTEYLAEVVGGSGSGEISDIPAGRYMVVVRNCKSNLQFAETAESIKITGAVGFNYSNVETVKAFLAERTYHDLSNDGDLKATTDELWEYVLNTDSGEITVSIPEKDEEVTVCLYSMESVRDTRECFLGNGKAVTFDALESGVDYCLQFYCDSTHDVIVSD